MTEMNSCRQPAQEAAFRELADGGVVLHLGARASITGSTPSAP